VYLIRSLQPVGRGVVPCAFHKDCIPQGVSVVVYNATFNNISVISWWSVLLMEENGVVFLNCFSCVLCNIVCRVVLLAIVLYVLRCQSLATCRWFYPVSSNKTGHHDISDILLKVALNTINQPTLLFTACGYPFGFFKRFSSHHVTSVPHDHEYFYMRL
jgi:hypothetical protein